jgi:hypothetical protein
MSEQVESDLAVDVTQGLFLLAGELEGDGTSRSDGSEHSFQGWSAVTFCVCSALAMTYQTSRSGLLLVRGRSR